MNKSQTNRLLGYPEDARLLILNADDFGMCHSVNEAIFRAFHPALDTPQLLAIEPEGNHTRQTDFDFFDVTRSAGYCKRGRHHSFRLSSTAKSLEAELNAPGIHAG